MNNLRNKICHGPSMCKMRYGVRVFSYDNLKSWVPRGEMEDFTVKALTWEMEQFQRKSAERTVPWFLRNMPPQYFKEIEKDLQRDHLRAMTALSEAGLGGDAEEETQKMCEFSAKGQLEKLRSLVNSGADPNKGDYDGRTPMHLAAAEGHLHVLKYLAEMPGANLFCVDRFGGTPLDDADRAGNINVKEWLLEMKDNPPDQIALSNLRDEPSTTELMLKSRNRKHVSFFNSKFEPETVKDMMRQLDLTRYLSRAKGFVVKDRSMVVTVFEYGTPKFPDNDDLTDPNGPASEILKYFEQNRSLCNEQDLHEYIKTCPNSYLEHTPPAVFFLHMNLMSKIEEENVVCTLLPNTFTDDANTYWCYVFTPNVFAHSEMTRLVNYLAVKEFKIERFHMNQFRKTNGGLVVQRLLLRAPPTMDLNDDVCRKFEGTMRRLKFLDDLTLSHYEKLYPRFTVQQCEILVAIGNMIYGVINKDLPYAFTLDRLHQTVLMQEHEKLAFDIAKLFEDRFNPENPCEGEEFEARCKAIKDEIDETVQTNIWQRLFWKYLEAVKSTYRTNLYVPERMSLTMRIDPELMMSKNEGQKERPFGVFFGHARRCNGFHVRFREIARGGLRVVPVVSGEAFGLESTRHFDEVYGLASAQQLKNKDIPEGGSKAVLLVNTKERIPGARDTLMRRCVKYFGDGILDLITPDEKTKSHIVDYWGQPELLYLGPDENIIPEDIVWLTERAAVRGMKYPQAFMSSKPDAGINHKVYGVTSEGVAVFLQVALQQNGIDPFTQPFTVKLTGGPNGDVAGNMIRILRRDYPNTAKIVGMSDHSGAVECTGGLDIEELYRLHVEDLPIDEYDPAKLNGGELNLVNTAEGTQKRNTMHNRISADVFVPAGGRPNTINALNWKHFLDAEGKPSSPLIVEAANIYITPDARRLLGEQGVMIVKDSSANKAGVCCSSYEIVASMLLSKDEFMEIKTELVEDVLERLREIAKQEAELLFREAKLNPSVQIPDVAVNISKAITRCGDIFEAMLSQNLEVLDKATRERLVVESLPKKLVEVADNRLADLPPAYTRAMLCSSLASRMVYNEGLEFVENLEDSVLKEVATKYLSSSDRLQNIITEVGESDLPRRDEIVQMLKLAGVRTAMGVNSFQSA